MSNEAVLEMYARCARQLPALLGAWNTLGREEREESRDHLWELAVLRGSLETGAIMPSSVGVADALILRLAPTIRAMMKLDIRGALQGPSATVVSDEVVDSVTESLPQAA